MKKYKLNVPERKELVTRLVDLTGQRARYTFMPRCAYEVGGYSVEKDGDVMVSEDVNPEDLQTLLNEGWIVPDGVDATEEARMEPAALQDTMVDEHAPDLDGGCVESEEQSDAESEDTDDARRKIPMTLRRKIPMTLRWMRMPPARRKPMSRRPILPRMSKRPKKLILLKPKAIPLRMGIPVRAMLSLSKKTEIQQMSWSSACRWMGTRRGASATSSI